MKHSNAPNADSNASNMRSDADVVLPGLSYEVTGCCFRVHNELGRYCSEGQYGDALERVLRESSVLFEREKVLDASFPGERSGRNRVDFLIADKLVLEIKVKPVISREDYMQVRRYLAALRLPLGILVNFQQQYLHPKRVLNASARGALESFEFHSAI